MMVRFYFLLCAPLLLARAAPNLFQTSGEEPKYFSFSGTAVHPMFGGVHRHIHGGGSYGPNNPGLAYYGPSHTVVGPFMPSFSPGDSMRPNMPGGGLHIPAGRYIQPHYHEHRHIPEEDSDDVNSDSVFPFRQFSFSRENEDKDDSEGPYRHIPAGRYIQPHYHEHRHIPEEDSDEVNSDSVFPFPKFSFSKGDDDNDDSEGPFASFSFSKRYVSEGPNHFDQFPFPEGDRDNNDSEEPSRFAPFPQFPEGERVSTYPEGANNGPTPGDGYLPDIPSSRRSCGVRGPSRLVASRIVGGSEAQPGEFPWHVHLERVMSESEDETTTSVCGGAVVNEWWVVTAAHCVHGASPPSITITAGEHNLTKHEGHEQKRRVSQILLMDNYNIEKNHPDIALLQLSTPLLLNKWVSPICLPDDNNQFLPGSMSIVAGWGRVRAERNETKLADTLQYLVSPIDEPESCWGLQFKGDCQVCSGARGQSACKGDSGGALACKQEDGRYYLCGIASFVSSQGCALPDYPAVYADVTCYADRIRRKVNTMEDMTDHNQYGRHSHHHSWSRHWSTWSTS